MPLAQAAAIGASGQPSILLVERPRLCFSVFQPLTHALCSTMEGDSAQTEFKIPTPTYSCHEIYHEEIAISLQRQIG